MYILADNWKSKSGFYQKYIDLSKAMYVVADN